MPSYYRLLLRTASCLCFLSLAVQALTFTPIRVNAGGGDYVDPQGTLWAADNGYRLAGSTESTTQTISGTASPGIYQTDRNGKTILYTFAVPNGTYNVNLRFAETQRSSPGQRVFSVALNQQWVLANLDIVAQAGGPNRALDKTFTVNATTGLITIQLTGTTDNAIINGIEILPSSGTTPAPGGNTSTTPTGGTTTATPPGTTTNPPTTGSPSLPGTPITANVIRVSAGGPRYTDPQGNVWAADYNSWGATSTYTTAATIQGTEAQPLYQHERWGSSFLYRFAVPNGNYMLKLKFAENYWTLPNRRIFDVSVNGQWMLANFDIFAQAGGPNMALDKTFNVSVTTNVILIQFTSVVDNAKIDAIEIVPQGTTTNTTSAPQAPVQVAVSPTAISINPGGTSQFNISVSGTSNNNVQWSLTPPVGTISPTGMYGAPSTVTVAQTVTVMATSLADPSKTASAAVSLVPTIQNVATTPPPVVTRVSPNQVSLSQSQTQQFSVVGLPSTSGTPGSTVTVGWSINPAVGSIDGNGNYKAPAAIASQQSVIVTAANTANSAVLGTASVTLVPPAAPPAAPAGLTAGPGNAQITLNWGASSGATSYNVKRATTNGGPYTTISGGVTATNYVDSGLANGTTYFYVVSAVSGNGESSNSNQASAQPTAPAAPVPAVPTGLTATPGDGRVTLTWAGISGATGYNVKRGTSNGGPYSTIGSSVPTNTYLDSGLANGTTYYYVVSAVNTSGEGSNSGQASAKPVAPPTAPTTIQLPVEVIGPDGTTVTVTLPVPAGTNVGGQMQLWMQIHGLRTQTQASVQVNNSGWTPINSGSVTLLGQANAYGGIGGGFHTLTMTLNLPAGAVVSGANTVSFRFNGTDGRVSGYRVLALNIQNSGGGQLIPSTAFANEDPNTWQPPSTSASDISAGHTLWSQAALTVPTGSGAQPIKAHCSDCHAQDGRDLKYFNYSNNSIRARSQFHGLTSQQGDQIASYIRTLNVPNPGRPWNPPYQPGPGLDSQPVEQWSAGAGLSSVLNSDQDMLNAMFPTGVQTSFFSPNGSVSAREIPIPLQLPDWNSWLPTIHPIDAWPDFAGSGMLTRYNAIRAQLVPGSPSAYKNAQDNMGQWTSDYLNYISGKVPAPDSPAWTPTYVNQVYSTSLWTMVKSWEINQEFGLEGMARTIFTHPKAEPRAWFSQFAFTTSPNMEHIPRGIPGLDNGSLQTWTYLSMIWYHTQLILNNSEYAQGGNSPIDWQYVYGFIVNLSSIDYPPQAGLITLWLTKAIEISNNGVAPNLTATGFNWVIPDISQLVMPGMRTVWTTTSAAQRAALYTGFAQAWLNEVQTYTPQQYYAVGYINPTSIPARGQPSSVNWQDRIWYMIPQFRFFGVNQGLINQMAAWAQTIWPNADWTATTTATCAPDNGDPRFARCSTEQ